MAGEPDQVAIQQRFEPEAAAIGGFTIGFALPSGKGEALDVRLGGSGTLITIDGTDGILTAEHVIRSLEQQPEYIGLILAQHPSSDFHQLYFKMSHSRPFVFPNQSNSAAGPDLGFLVLPPDTTASVRAKKVFYNASMRRERILDDPAPIAEGFWVISGMAHEWTKDAPPAMGFKKIKVFRGMVGLGDLTREYYAEGFDYLVFESLYNEGYEGPDSYEGYSGSGIWHLLGTRVDGKMQVLQRVLSGVAFHQSEVTERGEDSIREITCHGRRSVYGNLVDAVRQKLA